MNAIILTLSLAASGGSASPNAARDVALPRNDLEPFAVEISSHAARKDTQFAAFHGCIDWHSAVHGHWALFRLARLGVRPELAAEADARLTAKAIKAERKLLRENPAFELPYGRAWFLRLALEREAWAAGAEDRRPGLLEPMAEDAADALLAHYERFPPTPFAGEYANASWALAQLHAYLSARGDEKRLARLAPLLDRMLAAGSAGFDADFGLPEFFSIFGNWAYLVATARPAALLEFLARRPLDDAALEPVPELQPYPHTAAEKPEPEAHQLGLNWSRAWAMKALGRGSTDAAQKARFTRAYARHVERGLAERAEHGKDYGRYGHWVPQFAVYALTDGEL